MRDKAVSAISTLKDKAVEFWDNIRERAEEIWSTIKNTVVEYASNMKEDAVDTFRRFVSGIKSALSGVYNAVVDSFSSAIGYITGLPEKGLQWGADFVEGIAQGIRSAIGKVTSAVSDVAGTIKSWLHFSRPDEGPLHYYEEWMPDFMKGLAQGINRSKKYVEKAVSSVADAMSLTMQSGFDMKFDGISGAMLDGGSGATIINNYNNDNSRTVNQTNNSPKSLSRLEIYRQTRNALNV